MTVDDVIKLVNHKTNIDIRDKKRDTIHVFARCVYYDIAYNILKLGGSSVIAKAVNRDHASLLHSLKNVLPDMASYYPQMNEVREEILIELDLEEMDKLNLREKISRLTIINRNLLERINNEVASATVYTPEEVDMLEMLKTIPKKKLSAIKTILDPRIINYASNNI